METATEVSAQLERIAKEAKGNIASVQDEIKSLKESNQKLVEENQGLAARFQQFEQHELTRMTPGGYSAPRKSIADQLGDSDSFKALAGRESRSAHVRLDYTIKNLVNDGNSGDASDNTYDSEAVRDPRLANDARRRLTLIDELPTLPVEGSSFEYVALNSYSNAADEQSAEGAAKSEASLPTELKTAKIATIAHFLIASEQVLDDTPALAQQIQSLLTYGISAKLEALLVGGSGIIEGLETLGTAFTASSGLGIVDAISEAEAALDSAGWRASHVLLNPVDWHQIRSERDNEGSYVANGWSMPSRPNIWGLRAIATPSVTSGQPVVLDANQVSILDRQSATFEAFRQDSDHIRKNLVSLRAEMRAGLAVFAPSAVRLVSTV